MREVSFNNGHFKKNIRGAMPRFIDISDLELKSGSKVIDKIPNTNPIRWRCKCVCGEIFDKQGYDLKNGRDLCPDCLYARTLKTKRDRSITWSKNQNKFEKGMKCSKCGSKAHPDCFLDDEAHCRDCYVSDQPYKSSGIFSNLSGAY